MIDNQKTDDMKCVINEYTKFGYEKVFQEKVRGNIILIYAKEK